MTEAPRSYPDNAGAINTDRELWRGPDDGGGSYYSDSIHVTQGGGIGIDVDGYVIVKPLRDWHALATSSDGGVESRHALKKGGDRELTRMGVDSPEVAPRLTAGVAPGPSEALPEFYPLTMTSDEFNLTHQVIDADTAHIFQIVGSPERAKGVVETLNLVAERGLVLAQTEKVPLGAEHPDNYRLAFSKRWTPDQFWQFVEGLTDPFVRDQIRDTMIERGLSLPSTASGSVVQGQPNLKQIEAAIDDHLGNIDATYEDSRRRCAQSILNLYAVPSTESK